MRCGLTEKARGVRAPEGVVVVLVIASTVSVVRVAYGTCAEWRAMVE